MLASNRNKSIRYYLIALAAYFGTLSSMSSAEEGWTRKADMPTARGELSASVVNGKIYTIGGRGAPSTVEEYDPGTDTWTRKANMPTGRWNLATCTANGKIYAISGATGQAGLTRTVEAYDPTTDTWTRKADIPLTGYQLGAGVVDGKIYVIRTHIQIYDPATDTWSVGAETPKPIRISPISVVNGKIYVVGGSGFEAPWPALSIVEEYDPATDTWTRKADIPTPRHDLSTSAVNGIIYAIGGRSENNTPLPTVEAYDPKTDTWTQMPDMQVPRYNLATCTLQGNLYAIGGDPRTGAVEAYQAGPWGFASNPSPVDGVLHLDTWVTLNWTPGDFAASHDVYFSDNFNDVNTGAAAAFRGNQNATFLVAGFAGFVYPEGLVRGSTYYWRIDEINDLHPESPWIGDVWSFTIPSKKAYHPDPPDGTESVDLNVELSWTAGLGAQLHTVYFGDSFDNVGNATDGIQLGVTNYAPGPVKPGKTYYWRIDEFSSGRGVETYKGDTWSFTTVGAVGNPQPANGASDVGMNATLSWTPATSAASHELYFGTDKATVRNADMATPEYKGSVALDAESYDPGLLEADTAYYWRVDEVDDQGSTSTGPIWSFMTGAFLLVDDFEGYTDDDAAGQAIWQTWIDGFGIPDNGAQVGYLFPPYAEQIIVRSGSQSMPLLYVNEEGVTNSEAVMILTAPRDWTAQGVEVLSLWFRGYPASLGSFTEGPAGTFTIIGAGSDIAWTSDEFHFAYKVLTGPGSITVRVDSIEHTHDWAKAGVMIRETLNPDSMHAFACLTAAQGISFGCRDSIGGRSFGTNQSGITAPHWLKLERDVAGTFRAFHSADGSNWQSVENSTLVNIQMNSDVYIGMAVTSIIPIRTCEAVFSNLTITGTVSSQWTNRDIGILSNNPEPLYVAIANSGGAPAVVYHDDPNAATTHTWKEWNINLNKFAEQGVDLTDVDKIAIGLGIQGNAATPGGSGKMYFDDIRLYRPRAE